jgi:hypothetical protein
VQNLRAAGDAASGPVLVVAPTGLLENWKKEARLHLHEPGMGEICEAYGTGLKALRAGPGRDIHRRMPMLDANMIRRADWVLTTYETLRDYHHSFAAIRFSAIAFDEIQKLKNPASQLARGAKALNADFMLALTGTPVENRIEDLWAIMDVAYPGFLPASLKSFTEDYKPDDIDALRRLRADLMEPGGGALPVMMRRMKAGHVEGLPEKHVHRRPETMPPAQAKTYADVVENAQLGRIGMLEALHGMRGASLHPIDPQQGRGIDANQYCDMSARLRTTFVILSEIQRKGEKALIFLESLEMQALLAVIIKQRFGLKLEPLRINGNLVGKARLDAVEAFEDPAKRGFDVMILSPKAGGVGLNITAANHVIHLSRWWNPAVEDQCTDRAYRIGQNKPVHIYYPQAIHPSSELKSFDLIVDELLDRKRRLSADLLIAPVLPGDEGELYSATVGTAPLSPGEGKDGDPDISIEEIDRMEPKAFEDWVLRRAQRLGYRSNRTPVTGDAGADGIIIHAAGERIFVQCKHRQPQARCDDEAIVDLLKARESYNGPDRLVAITNAAGFTTKARERADRFGVTLIARDHVAVWPHGCL